MTIGHRGAGTASRRHDDGASYDEVRVLLVADTHVGFDLARRPRIERRRRGHDFMANFERALAPALDGRVDVVVHGGDLLYRSRVPVALVEEALAPLVRVADGGVPVFLVPGNHERSAIPLTLGGASPRLRVFRSPGTEVVCVRGIRVAVSGLPFARAAEGAFEGLVAATRWFEAQADVRLLCTHLLFEGATVGPSDHVFRGGCDVVRGGAIPSQFAAVLSGHVHRSQVLVNDLRGRPLGAPVIYPGSVERTSFAERDESKCFAVLRFDGAGAPRGRLLGVRFHRLPARPMVAIDVPRGIRDGSAAARFVRDELARAPSDAVVSVRVSRDCDRSVLASLGCRRLRAMAPDSMNVTLSVRS